MHKTCKVCSCVVGLTAGMLSKQGGMIGKGPELQIEVYFLCKHSWSEMHSSSVAE